MRAPDFWKHRGPVAQLLAPLGHLYGMSIAWKAAHASPYRAAMPVLCVGNLTAGGSGKTRKRKFAHGRSPQANGTQPSGLHPAARLHFELGKCPFLHIPDRDSQ